VLARARPLYASHPLLLILLAGAVVRLALWSWFANESIHIWDEQDYNKLAINLVQRHEFSLEPGAPVSHRPPLYPAALAGVYSLFGIENFQAVRLIQAGLSLLNVLLMHRLGSQIFNPRIGLWAAGTYCFYPSLLGFNTLLLTEVLFTFLLCAACYTLVRSLQRESIIYLLLAGILLGLGALTRSVLWLFPAVLTVFIALVWRGSLKRRALASSVLLAAFSVTIAPWVIRNTSLERTFVAIDTLGGRNFMMGNYRYTPLYRAWDAVSLQGQQSWYYELTRVHPASALRTQGQIDRLAFQQGMKFVLENPGLTLQRDIVKFFHFWGLERELLAGASRGYFGPIERPAMISLTLLIFGSYVVAMLSAVVGLVMVPPADKRIQWLLLLVVGFICAVHTVTFGHSRYHLPVMPLLLLYSAAAVTQARGIWGRRNQRAFWLACGLCTVFVLGWLWEIVVVDGERYWTMLRSAR
jgi:4-amino-4-deoxy-L-arabinose transferase-like glycosyltransferase